MNFLLALRDSYLKQEKRELWKLSPAQCYWLISGSVPMKAVFPWLDQLSWHRFLPSCQLGATFHCALHFIYTLAEARFPCRLLNHLGMALVQMLTGSWFLCGLLNSLGMNIAQIPTESSVPETCCFHLLILSGNKKRGTTLQTTSGFFFPLEVFEGKKKKKNKPATLRDKETLG